jgi:uncharacterized membrane protein
MTTSAKLPSRDRLSKTQKTPRPNAVHSESPTDRTIEAIANIEQAAQDSRSWMDHVAGAITRVAGSGSSILFHMIWFSLWLLINLHAVPGIEPFDPYPFNLLTTVVSLEAIFLTLFVLISQNRMSREADKRAQLDLQVNLLAEKETTTILRMLQGISKHLGVDGSATEDLHELLEETRVDELAEKLEDALPSE